jgi:hypothetical protein
LSQEKQQQQLHVQEEQNQLQKDQQKHQPKKQQQVLEGIPDPHTISTPELKEYEKPLHSTKIRPNKS